MMVKTVERKVGKGQKGQGRRLPDGWRWVRLGEVSKLQSGYAFKSKWFTTEGIRLLRNANVIPGKIEWEDTVYLPVERMSEFQAYKLDVGDIVLSLDRPIISSGLKVARLSEKDIPSLLLQRVGRFQPSDELNPDYLYFVLNSQLFINSITGHDQSIGVPHISPKQVESVKIPLPPLEEQRRIVGILRDRMSAIEKARLATEAQLEAAQALPAAYLRQIFDSPEAQKWKKKRLGDIAETSSGSTPSRRRDDYYIGEIPWVKTGELKDGTIYDTEEHISELALKETSVKLLPKTSLLIAMYGQGQTRGRTGILAVPATTNQACFAIQPNDQLFDTSYLQFWFRHNYNRLREETEGRGGNQPNLNGKLLQGQMVPLPDLEVQKNIVAKLQETGEEVTRVKQSLQDQLNTINALPAALLHQAFNGEL